MEGCILTQKSISDFKLIPFPPNSKSSSRKRREKKKAKKKQNQWIPWNSLKWGPRNTGKNTRLGKSIVYLYLRRTKSWIDPVGTQTCCSTSLVISASLNPFISPLRRVCVRWRYTRFWYEVQLKEKKIVIAQGPCCRSATIPLFPLPPPGSFQLAAQHLSLTTDQGPFCVGAMRYCHSSQLFGIDKRRRTNL